MTNFISGINKFVGRHKKITGLIIIIALVGVFLYTRVSSSSNKPQYQTAQVTKGTLVVSVTESGQVSVSNKASVVTQASGIVNNVYVKTGDYVSAGAKIADVTLDTAGQQRQAQAWSSYLNAQNSLASAQANLYTLQNQEFVANQKFMNDAVANNMPTNDPIYIEEQATWLAAEAAYKNQTGVINQAQSALNNASLAYQLTSGTITAPTSGTVGDLTITKGMQIGSSNTTAGSSTNVSNQQIASISTGNPNTVSINIAEVDAPQVKVGQDTTVTFDALPNKTFTGKVIGINTTGTVTSGVTTYPAVIELDSSGGDIYPNMSATANIITKIDNNVLLIPTSAVQTVGTQSTVRVINNGQVTTVPVTTGDSSSTQTVITSGLTDGETVVTGVISGGSSSSSSPFGGGLRVGGGGGAVFRGAGGRGG